MRLVQPGLFEHGTHHRNVDRVAPVRGAGQCQLHRLQTRTTRLGDECLERLGRRAQIEGRVDITGSGHDPTIGVGNRNRAVVECLDQSRANPDREQRPAHTTSRSIRYR